MFEFIIQWFSVFQNCLGAGLIVVSVIVFFATIHLADKKYNH
jgi:hypothetical protein